MTQDMFEERLDTIQHLNDLYEDHAKHPSHCNAHSYKQSAETLARSYDQHGHFRTPEERHEFHTKIEMHYRSLIRIDQIWLEALEKDEDYMVDRHTIKLWD